MFYSQKKMKDVQALAGMLQRFNEAIDTTSAESMYTWNSLTPYLTYFSSLFVVLISFGLADKAWIPCSELVTLCLFFTVACFMALSDAHDHLALISIGCSVMASLPSILDHFPRIPVVYHLVQLLFGPGFEVEIMPNIHINFGLPSAMYLIVPVLFIRMAARNKWQGWYKVLIPHLVCFFWFQLTVLFYRNSTWMGLLRGTVGWITAIALLPVFVLAILGGTFYYLSSFLTLSSLLKLLTTLSLLAIPAGIAVWAKRGFKVKGVNLDGNKSKLLLALISVFTVIPFLAVWTPPEPKIDGAYLSWETYRDYCSKPVWDQHDIAYAQVQCNHLRYMLVSWTGTVKKVVVKNTDNPSQGFVDLFPLFIGNWLKCTYGEEYPDDPENCSQISKNPQEVEICKLHIAQGIKCHMNHMNRYLFEMWVHMPIDKDNVHDVRVEARHGFKDVLLGIKAGNNIFPILSYIMASL